MFLAINVTTVIALLIWLLPVFFAAVGARRTTFIHGIVAFIFWSCLITFVFVKFVPESALSSVPDTYSDGIVTGIALIKITIVDTLIELVNELGLNLSWFTFESYGFIGAVAGLWVVEGIIAFLIRRSRKDKINDLKRRARKY